MLSLVSNKKNIVILSGLVSHKPFVNVGKSGKPYATFMLAQSYNKNGIEGVRYFKVVAFEPQAVKFVGSITKQTIIEIDGHISLSSYEKNLTLQMVADNIKSLIVYDMPLQEKGGINPQDYTQEKVYNDHTPTNIDDDELSRLEEQMKSLK